LAERRLLTSGGDISSIIELLSRHPGRFPSFPQTLSFLPHHLKRLAELARFLGQLSGLLGLITGALP
jgi:hypothetical protein